MMTTATKKDKEAGKKRMMEMMVLERYHYRKERKKTRECERVERGRARRRTEDKPRQRQRRGGDERGWRQCDCDDDNGDGAYEPNVK